MGKSFGSAGAKKSVPQSVPDGITIILIPGNAEVLIGEKGQKEIKKEEKNQGSLVAPGKRHRLEKFEFGGHGLV